MGTNVGVPFAEKWLHYELYNLLAVRTARLCIQCSFAFVSHFIIQAMSIVYPPSIPNVIIMLHLFQPPTITTPANSQRGTRTVKLILFSSHPSHKSEY